jgi:hypothetical protein
MKTKIDINSLEKETAMSSIESIVSNGWLARRVGALGAAAAVALALGAAACNDTSDPDNSEGPAVLLTERVFTPQGERFYYVSVLPDVPTAAVDRSQALELTSADVEIYNNRVFIRDRDANTITRYQVTAARQLVPDGDPVSFAGTGLGKGRYSNAYLAADRAYVLDSGGWRLIGWNPTTMLLTGEIISIDNMAKHALPTGAISPTIQVGNRQIAAITWASFDAVHPIGYPGAGAIIFDPGAPPVFVEDARVGGAFRVSPGGTGGADAYVTGVIGGDVRMFGSMLDNAPAPASGELRILAGQTAFDPTYAVDVEAITRSKGVWAIHRLDDNTLLVQVLDPALSDAEVPTNISDYGASARFVFGFIDIAAGTFTPQALPPEGGRGNAGNHVVDGKLYIQLSDAVGTAHTYAVSAAGITPSFTVPSGDLWFMQRVR